MTAVAIYFLAYRRGISPTGWCSWASASPRCSPASPSYLLTRAQICDAQRATVWLTGSLNGRGWEHVRPVGLALLLLAPLVLVLARPLRALQLGDDAAKGLGVGVERYRAGLILAAVALAAVATASAGPVAFVAFVAPPIARRLTAHQPHPRAGGPGRGRCSYWSPTWSPGGCSRPPSCRSGIITGIVGAPYLLWLLARANRVGRGG